MLTTQPGFPAIADAPAARTPVMEHHAGSEDATVLMARIAQRDREAFGALYLQLAPKLRSFLLARRCEATLAEELVQETMLTVWRKAASYDPRKAAVTTWIFTIARNRFIDRVRKLSRPAPDPEDPSFVQAPEEPDATVDRSRRAARLHEALSGLPPEQHAILHKSYFEGQSQSSIADDLGVPLGTVKSRTRLAMGHLREALGEDAG